MPMHATPRAATQAGSLGAAVWMGQDARSNLITKVMRNKVVGIRTVGIKLVGCKATKDYSHVFSKICSLHIQMP